MPSLFKFLTVVGAILALGYGGLYILAVHFEPSQTEVSDPLPTIKIRKK